MDRVSTYLENLIETGSSINEAFTTYSNVFKSYNYDAVSNGFNAVHCYANCLVAKKFKGNREMFGLLMDANLAYEQCTKYEICEGWCGDTDKYFRDVVSDFEADALGICGGLDDRDCVEVCKSQANKRTGPQQPTDNDPQCNDTDKECCKRLFRDHYPNLIPDSLDQVYNDHYPSYKRSYAGICPDLYRRMLIYEEELDKLAQ